MGTIQKVKKYYVCKYKPCGMLVYSYDFNLRASANVKAKKLRSKGCNPVIVERILEYVSE